MSFSVWAGYDDRQAEATDIFIRSVRANASSEVDVLPLRCKLPIRRPGTTAFTYIRFLVPWLCGFDGRALFCDGADQLCLGDVMELAELDMGGAAVMVVKHPDPRRDRARVWSSVMLMDCRRLRRWTPQHVEKADADRLMRLRDLSDAEIGNLQERWNVLLQPGEDPPPGTAIAHWSSLSNPNMGNWVDCSRSHVWAAWRI